MVNNAFLWALNIDYCLLASVASSEDPIDFHDCNKIPEAVHLERGKVNLSTWNWPHCFGPCGQEITTVGVTEQVAQVKAAREQGGREQAGDRGQLGSRPRASLWRSLLILLFYFWCGWFSTYGGL